MVRAYRSSASPSGCTSWSPVARPGGSRRGFRAGRFAVRRRGWCFGASPACERIAPRMSRPVATTSALLEIRGLAKRFGGVLAVNGLDLSIEAGEVRGLIGPNGSGKTTTINLISALYRPDHGEIRLGGERIERLRPHEVAARGVARTFQISKLFANMTVLENVLV